MTDLEQFDKGFVPRGRLGCELIPFGKHKGKPVETLAEDRQYTEWLMAQPWFRERYANIYTVVVNNFTEPTQTPEHNRLQALFLKPWVRWQVAALAIPELADAKPPPFADVRQYWLGKVRTLVEKEMARSMVGGRYLPVAWGVDANPRTMFLMANQKRIWLVRNREFVELPDPRIEDGGVDASYGVMVQPVVWSWAGNFSYNERPLPWLESKEFDETLEILKNSYETLDIEIKPEIGDDYPAILRQIKSQRGCGRRVLFTERYRGTGASKQEFEEIFRLSRIAVVYVSQLSEGKPSLPEFGYDDFGSLRTETEMLLLALGRKDSDAADLLCGSKTEARRP